MDAMSEMSRISPRRSSLHKSGLSHLLYEEKNTNRTGRKRQSTPTIWSSQFNMVKIWMIIISIKNSDNNLLFLDALLDDWSKFHRHQRFVPSIEILKIYVNFQLSGHTRLFMVVLKFFAEVTYFWGVFFMFQWTKKGTKWEFLHIVASALKSR